MNLPPIVQRSEATGTTFFTGKPCRRGHIAERRVSSGACVECLREHDRARYAAQVVGGTYRPRGSPRETPTEAPSGAVELLHPRRDDALLLLRQIAFERDLCGPVYEMNNTVIRHHLSDFHKQCTLNLPSLPSARRTRPSLP